MYHSLSNTNNDDSDSNSSSSIDNSGNISISIKDGTSTINTTSSSTAPSSTNIYLNNIRKEISSNPNTTSGNNDNKYNIHSSSNSINNGGSTISMTTSIDNLNNTLLEKNPNVSESFQNLDMDENLSPEYIRYSKMISSLSYIGVIGAALVLINEKSNVYIQFHAYQSFYVAIGVVGIQLFFLWSTVISTIIWLSYLFFIVFMIFKVFLGSHGRQSFYKLPIIGKLSENRAIQRSLEYSKFLKYQDDLLKYEIYQLRIRAIRKNRNNRNNLINSRNSNTENSNNQGHSRINSNTSSMMMSSDIESILNSSGSNSSIYDSDHENMIGTNEE